MDNLIPDLSAFLTPLPCFANEASRRAVLINAGLSDLLPSANLSGSAYQCVASILHDFEQYGRTDALLQLLQEVRNKVGGEKQAECDALIDRLRGAECQPAANRILPPTDANKRPEHFPQIGQKGDQFDSGGGNMNIAKDQAMAIQNNYYGGVSEARFDMLKEELSVTKSALKSFFKILQEQHVPLEDLDSKLRKIAAERKELLQRLEVIQSEDEEVVRLKTQAQHAIEDGKFDEAETLLNQAEKRDLDAIEQLEETSRQRRLSAAETTADNAQLQSVRLRYKKAADYFLQAAQILPEGHEEKRAIWLNAAGENLYCISRYTEALPLFEQSLTTCREGGDSKEEARVLHNIGLLYDVWSDYTTALAYLEESLVIRRKILDKIGEGTTLNNISQIYKARGDYMTALTYLEQSLSLRSELGDKHGEGTVLNNMGAIYIEFGKEDMALPIFEKGLKIFCETGDKIGEAATLCNISRVFKARKDYTKALAYLERSLTIERTLSNKFGEARVLGNIGKIYLVQGEDIITASVYLKQSLAIQNEIGDKSGKGTTLSDLGMSALAHGDDTTALMYFEQSLAIFRETGRKPEEGTAYWNIGQTYANQGDFVKAEEYSYRAVQIAEEIGSPKLELSRTALERVRQALKQNGISGVGK